MERGWVTHAYLLGTGYLGALKKIRLFRLDETGKQNIDINWKQSQ